ncbi:MAG: dCMP deaminase family protein [Bacteriovoracaceae bacterium]|jgi:dCMP deaminase|nr:cytidine deaminase [Halobacteriovoraceae bacterium]MDP7320733.1 dCMP deaminase family protein [Bacteriovoracaceae bacterium]
MKDNPNYFSVKSILSWDEYFMLQAMMASFKSKDPATKVGCVFVDENNHQLTMGYNGFIAGINENQLPWGKDKNQPLEHQKYGYVVHSEANAILHSPRSLNNSTCYVTLFPCNECAKLLASVKIKKVVYLSDKHATTESTKIAKKIFDLTGIEYQQLIPSEDLISKLNKHLIDMCQAI